MGFLVNEWPRADKAAVQKNFFLAEKANRHRKVKIMYNYVDGDLCNY